jgi:hypothetical protein
VEITDIELLVLVSQECRTKVARIVTEFDAHMTYLSMVPYPEGLHLTLKTWWSTRDEHGWKIATRRLGASKTEETTENPSLRSERQQQAD